MHFMKGNNLIFTSWKFYEDSVLKLKCPTAIRKKYHILIGLFDHILQQSKTVRTYIITIFYNNYAGSTFMLISKLGHETVS